MKIQCKIKNYRCFVSPAIVDIQKGFTAFVGVNNAGKSTVMRLLLELRPLFQSLSDVNYLHHAIATDRSINPFLHVLDQDEIFSNRNTRPIDLEFKFIAEEAESKGFHELSVILTISRERKCSASIVIDNGVLKNNTFQGFDKVKRIIVNGNRSADFLPFFETMASLGRSLYVGPFRNTINIGSKEDYLDIKIGQAFIEELRYLKTGPNKRANAGISRLTEQIRDVFGFQALDIAPASDNKSLHITVNGKPFKQHELGSGLSHFIIVLANAAIKQPDWILIDEPEMNLHPSLQLKFLTTLGGYAKEGVWFSSHSLGLARAAAEEIYSVSRVGEGDSIIRSVSETPRLAEFLGEMSFSSQKELGFEKLVLVEGPTELKVIQHFLRALSKDHRVLLLPIYGHMPKPDEFEELLRITTNVAVLIDSEKVAKDSPLEKNRAEFLDRCKTIGIPAVALELGATENYFPDETIKEVLGPQYNGLQPYQKLNQVQPRWSKNQNWKIAEAMSFTQIEKTDLGKFLQEL